MRPKDAPTAAMSMTTPTLKEVTPLFEAGLLVLVAAELVPVVLVLLVFNFAPTASAFFWNSAKEVLVPFAPALSSNTMPLPQWLLVVFAPCLQ